MGPDEILCHCVLEHERLMILKEAHAGVVGGRYIGKYTVHMILQPGLWWPTMNVDARDYCHGYDIYQRARNLS